ncbi:MAG TPA: hypothetical protein VGE62_03115 [Candidatus Paceibacterota bacterium]
MEKRFDPSQTGPLGFPPKDPAKNELGPEELKELNDALDAVWAARSGRGDIPKSRGAFRDNPIGYAG